MDLEDFRGTLSRLGFSSVIIRADMPDLSAAHYPCVYVDKKSTPRLLTGPDASLRYEDGTVILFEPITVHAEQPPLNVQLRRFSPLLRQIAFLSLVIGGLALAPVFFNRAIYDNIIAAGSTKGMPMLCAGVFLALVAELYIRNLRNRDLAFFVGRIDHFVSCSVFERLMYLPPLYTERASVSAQLARLRDFENVREFFTGPLAPLFFELPLIAIYLIVMAALSQWLVLVPLGLVFSYVILILLVNGRLKEYSRASATAATQRQEFLLETVTKLKDIRLSGAEEAWRQRYRLLSAQASLSAFRSNFAAQSLETASYVLMTVAGLATLSFGVMAVINQDLTTGALIGAMMLIWRINAPLQICCASISRIQQLSSSTKQVGRLLSLQPERDPYAPAAPDPHIKGRISFHRTTLRYSPETEPALLGVSFDIKPGQIVAVRGGNGSGKSTLLKMILGLYQPQGGSVRIDGVDIRQFDPVALRQSIAYIAQSVDLFPGTIRENMLFSNPLATEAEIRQALETARAMQEISRLPEGLDTRIEGNGASSIPFLLRQRINLARAYLKPAPIMLFDEASYSLGRDNDAAFAEKIAALRGKSTVVLVTHREDHMKLADILLVMDKGELTHAGPPQQVLTVLKGQK